MNSMLVALGLVLAAVWLVRLIYAPVGAYTALAMGLILMALAYFSTTATTYATQAQLLYTTKA